MAGKPHRHNNIPPRNLLQTVKPSHDANFPCAPLKTRTGNENTDCPSDRIARYQAHRVSSRAEGFPRDG